MTTLTPNTRLSRLLDTFPGVLEYIVSLNPGDFSRLHNPVLRKYMTPRITLARVAAIAEIPTEVFLRELAARCGDQAEFSADVAAPLPRSPTAPPAWMAGVEARGVQWVDVTPIDAVSGDPIPPINTAVKRMAPGSVIGIRHRWEPQPLYDAWQKMGIEWYSMEAAPDEWHIFVHKPEGQPEPNPNESVLVDLRHLPAAEGPPRVVAMFEQLPQGHSVEIWAIEQALPPVRELLEAQHPGQYDWENEPGSDGKSVARVTVRERQ